MKHFERILDELYYVDKDVSKEFLQTKIFVETSYIRKTDKYI